MFKFNFHQIAGGDIWTEREQRSEDRPPVTCFRINSGKEFDRWMHQNGGTFSGEWVDGCLIDSFIIATRRGYAAFYEHYVNTWTSDYYVEFQPGAAQDVFKTWYEFEEAAEQAAAVNA